jgi:predicted peroxiredoxin
MSDPIAFVISNKQTFDVVCALNPNLSTKSYSDLKDMYVVVNWPWSGRYSVMKQDEVFKTFKTVGASSFVNLVSLKDRTLIKKEK